MIIGLTGGIGSGKTYVSSLFEELGVPIYISDVEAKKIMNLEPEVIDEILNLFGEKAYVNKALNRKFIASEVFVNREKLNRLNQIVHPAVADHFKKWHKQQKASFVIKESAILFETGANKYCDAVILVTAPKDIRISRVTQRDKVSIQEVENRINNQWSDERKALLSDYIVQNTNRQNTIKRVKEIYGSINANFKSC